MNATRLEQQDLLDRAAPNERAGFRLQRLEVLNWGTFDRHVWSLNACGETSLLTGDIGSGKSTLVDALTTLLVAPSRAAYNKAAGAEARERNPRSYFFGHFKSERSAESLTAKPVSLRNDKSYSVLLASFFNEGYQAHVTLAQMLWMKGQDGQPTRFFVVSDRDLSITEHFSKGADQKALRKRLKEMGCELSDSYPAYATAFKKRLGINHEQALELFLQTVSMKAVGNLTDFVRQHMLQPFPVEERIAHLMTHVDDLTRAHGAVLKAKAQVQSLTPLVADCEKYAALTANVTENRSCRDAIDAWGAAHRVEILKQALLSTGEEISRLSVEVDEAQRERDRLSVARDDLNRDIANNGGERLERLRKDCDQYQRERDVRSRQNERYAKLAAIAGLPVPEDAHSFLTNAGEAVAQQSALAEEEKQARQETVEASMKLQSAIKGRAELVEEIEGLKTRESNIPPAHLALRTKLCTELEIDESELPYGGELMQVRPEERVWEGAIERVLGGLGVTLFVPEEHSEAVTKWVDKHNLGLRLTWEKVPAGRQPLPQASEPRLLSRKLAFKGDNRLTNWVQILLSRSFSYVCCENLEEFRKLPQALTRKGQVRSGSKHMKDDRRAIDDRTRYVLGWSTREKREALETERDAVERVAQDLGGLIAKLQTREKSLRERSESLRAIAEQHSFEEMNWQASVLQLEQAQKEIAAIEKTSNLLRDLQTKLREVEKQLGAAEARANKQRDQRSRAHQRQQQLEQEFARCQKVVAETPNEQRSRFDRLEELRKASSLPEFSLEEPEKLVRELRKVLNALIDNEEAKVRRLRDQIILSMEKYRKEYPVDTRDVDASLDAAHDYARMLNELLTDNLPKLERRFKELLNENTIREVATFYGQLTHELTEIEERIGRINRSLQQIDYNPNRYIRLESVRTTDSEIREFEHDLRACIDGRYSSSEDEAYSEAKFLQVKKIIERFGGREGFADIDKRWTEKVTDVRNWFTFSASERWRESDEEHEHYTDSGGKSGGQKEKLAYTVLAASLAYQFGLEWGETKSKTFRFVVIDEAFGRGSDESAAYGLELFRKLNLQLLVVTPLQKIHVIEPYVSNVCFVSNRDGKCSQLQNLTIEEFRKEQLARAQA